MSSFASPSTFMLLKENLSPVKGWRIGSMATFGQTSVRSRAVISLMRSCRIDGRTTLGQLKAWLTEKATPHGQWDRGLAGCQPYLMHKESRKACLCWVKPYLAMGMAVSQEDAPSHLIHGNLLRWLKLLLYSLGFLSSSCAITAANCILDLVLVCLKPIWVADALLVNDGDKGLCHFLGHSKLLSGSSGRSYYSKASRPRWKRQQVPFHIIESLLPCNGQ